MKLSSRQSLQRPHNLLRVLAFSVSCAVSCSVILAISLGSAPLSWASPPSPTDPPGLRLAAAALERTKHRVTYDGRYRAIDYPGGDVPGHLGVCTDVVIRSYRRLGVDLQERVHEDMSANFSVYPRNWGSRRPDTHIDHRRVPNLQTFFGRQGASLDITTNPADYKPGDLVTWNVSGRLPHIGIVVQRRSSDGERPLIVHNIGAGPKIEDVLFAFEITGHYRYLPAGLE